MASRVPLGPREEPWGVFSSNTGIASNRALVHFLFSVMHCLLK